MDAILRCAKLLPLLAACVLGEADWPDKPADLTTPTQQRIGISGPGSMSIGWNTYKELTIDEACVEYGTSPGQLSQKVCTPYSITYPTSRTWFHVVTLTNLTSATTYYYKIQSPSSEVEHFFSPRLPGDKTPFKMAVLGDLGVYGKDGFTIPDHSKRDMIPMVEPALNHTTIGRLATTVQDWELALFAGDFAYADDWDVKLYKHPKNVVDRHDVYEAVLEQFYQQLAPVAGRKAFQVVPGNHDAVCVELKSFTTRACPDGQKNFTDFSRRWGPLMPTAFPSNSVSATAQAQANKAKALAVPPFFYSFDYGMVHVVMVDTETDFEKAPDAPGGSEGFNSGPFGAPGQQLAFLEADLSSVDRRLTPWVFFVGHRPWYVTQDGNVCGPCKDFFEPLMFKYAVDLGIFGHVHNSQRTVPVYNNVKDNQGTKNPQAPMYIVAGGAGNIEGLTKLGKDGPFTAFANHDDFGFAQLQIMDGQNLKINFIRSSTGDIIDTSTLYKEHSVAFPVQDPAAFNP